MRKIAFLAIFLCVFACVFSQEPSNSVESENPTENVEENPEISQETPKSYENPEDYPENRVNPGPSDDFIREWESVMGDFIPEDISTFKMQGKSTEYFVQNVDISGTFGEVSIKGAFFIHDDDVKNFEMKVYNPQKDVVSSYFNKKEGIINVKCTMSGKYTFEFTNPSSDELKITIAAHYFHEEKNLVKNEELENLHDKLRNSLRIIKTMLSESKFGDTHRNAHLDVLSKGYKRLFYFTFLESAMVLIVTVLQVHFIEKLLSNKVSV